MRRFSRLDHALKLLRNPANVDNPNAVTPDPPANSALAKYAQFASGKVNINITRDAASLPGQLVNLSIQPFGLAATDPNKTLTVISKRAKQSVATYFNADFLNHLVGGSPNPRPGFQPARAVVFDVTSQSATTETSKITGIKYKKKAGKSLTYPFGAGPGADEKFELDVRAKLIISLNDKQPDASITFKPETIKLR